MGVEPICKALQFAPATYYARRSRPESARRRQDEVLKPEIKRVYDASLDGVYGAKKVWKQLRREGFAVARCTIERLMKELGLSGVQKGRRYKVTTIVNDALQRPSDLVDRHFVASAPNRLWVADLTYVKSHSGWVYVAFIIDVFSRFIVGWQVSNSLRSDLAIDALEMAIFARGDDLAGLVHHSDRGVQGEFNRLSQHPMTTEVFGGSSTTSSRPCSATTDEITGDSAAAARSRETVLDRDCQGSSARRSGSSRWCIPTRWTTSIP